MRIKTNPNTKQYTVAKLEAFAARRLDSLDHMDDEVKQAFEEAVIHKHAIVDPLLNSMDIRLIKNLFTQPQSPLIF